LLIDLSVEEGSLIDQPGGTIGLWNASLVTQRKENQQV
jgi:hypothetical protein